MDVASNPNRPGNLFVYITTYKDRGESRLGYVFYRDYGNEEYSLFMNRLITSLANSHTITDE
eukprot:1328170-Heterocapsa_arctica.AAC.1